MNEQLDILKLVTKQLAEKQIKYMLSGSVAMNYYAQPRMTRDIDIVIELMLKDVKSIVELFVEDFYIDEDMIYHAIQ